MIQPILVEAGNFEQLAPQIISEVQAADFIGFDIETQDEDRHDGLNQFMNVNPKTGKKAANRPLVFDLRRTVITGFSIYAEGSDKAYYVNLAHADTKNRVTWGKAKQLLDAKPEGSYWVCHNAPFEISNMSEVLGYDLGEKVICTLQMAVSAYGPDEYPIEKLEDKGLGGIDSVLGEASIAFRNYNPAIQDGMTEEQAEVFNKVVAKESDAHHSYNGLVKEIAYGYGLKKAVHSFFGVEMATFQNTLGEASHMGELTGREVLEYGADDAYWAVRLFYALLAYMKREHEPTIKAFFEQENPMIHVYADVRQSGMRVDAQGIERSKHQERQKFANLLRELKVEMNKLLPFDQKLHEKLAEMDDWYQRNGEKYRKRLTEWVQSQDSENDFEQVCQVAGSVPKNWIAEIGLNRKLTGLNLTHYMPVRTILYDLCRQKLIVKKGKVQSDAETRGRLLERLDEDTPEYRVVKLLGEIAGVEQRMKLYIAPYQQLMDPETSRMYPIVSSQLASRRMASSFPNAMQLAKQGESVYVRGYYIPDQDDHLLVSLDWSQVELVLIGELSGDPEFAKAYGQLPYEDLHSFAAAEILSAIAQDEITPEDFKALKKMDADVPEGERYAGKIPLVNHKGELMRPSEAYKYNRGTSGGKGANFNYWYSGALSSIGDLRGWDADTMWAVTDRYRSRFAVAEAWRTGTIEQARMNGGAAELPDGHRRVRYEVTHEWHGFFRQLFAQYGDEGITSFGNEVCRQISRRAGNQIVNSMIQGSCATLAKRSILNINKAMRERGWDHRIARFKMPIHDELLFSVHKDYVMDFLPLARSCMTHHPEIVSDLVLDCSASVGWTFEPFHAKRAPLGQVELDEVQAGLSFIDQKKIGGQLDTDDIANVIEYLSSEQRKAA